MDENLMKSLLYEIRELNKNIKNISLKSADTDELIDINTFAQRINVEVDTAREISRRRDLCEKGISVNINGKQRGGTRIVWQEYVKYVMGCPAVQETKRVGRKIG